MKTKMYKPKYNFSPQTKPDRVKSDNSRVKSGSENTSVRRDKTADTNNKLFKSKFSDLEIEFCENWAVIQQGDVSMSLGNYPNARWDIIEKALKYARGEKVK
jgi:hypothetical protein